MKIVYFDYWTLGIHNFKPIDQKLRNLDHETMLLHVGSFNSKQLQERMIDGIRCRDITYYNTRMIYKMLKKESPDVLITINATQILDRVVTISCRKLNIKSIYLMHGIRILDTYDNLIALWNKSYNSFLKKIKKIQKYITIVIPNYLYTLIKCRPFDILNFSFMKVIYSYFMNPGKSFYFPKKCDELLNEKCLVYSINEGRYYEKLGYKSNNIKIVGNPNNDALLDMIINNKFTDDMLPEKVRALRQTGKKYALYLEEGFPEQNNMGGYNEKKRNQFITDCAERLMKKDIKLVVKLHPVTDEKTIEANQGNVLIEKNNLDELIYFSEFCICHVSTTINNCVLMNKPILMPKWSGATNLPTFYSDLGISNRWDNINDELNLIIDRKAREKYIKDHISITTPSAVENVVREIIL